MGAWIEISASKASDMERKVAPFMGAWIEIVPALRQPGAVRT